MREQKIHVISQEEMRANRCYLVGPFVSDTTQAKSVERVRKSAHTSLQELGRLCSAAGLSPVAGEVVHVRKTHAGMYLGKGQVERVIEHAEELDAGVIVFDNTLSPIQLRNWARASHREVYDRHAVILEIFSRRAKTREAQLQVELARARYTQSHLVGMWQHLSRQGGGSRLARGEGEKQIEIDRRRLAQRVFRATTALKKVGRQRALRRYGRQDAFRVTLVGYTNAGKSSLLNALTGSDVRAADQLFASLDPTTRRLEFPDGVALVNDTVGFIRNLPPDLVDAFHSTLEEVIEADLLLLVLDVADPDGAQQFNTTMKILGEIGANTASRILVLNKIDNADTDTVRSMEVLGTHSGITEVFSLSAETGEGIQALQDRLHELCTDRSQNGSE